MIYTVTFNPAIDYVVRLDFFSLEESAENDVLFAIAQGMTAAAAQGG